MTPAAAIAAVGKRWLVVATAGLGSMAAAGWGAPPAVAQAERPAAEDRWIAPATSAPLALRFRHEAIYDPATRRVEVRLSRWDLQRLNLAMLGGVVAAEATARIETGRTADVAATVTLDRLDVRDLLRRLSVPRAEEIEARATGRLAVVIRAGEWARVDVRIDGEPGTVRISRRLIKDLLGPSFAGAMSEAQIDAALDQFFRGEAMIPLEGVRFEGALDEQSLRLRLPLRNRVLNVLLEPRLERDLLWSLWDWLKQAGVQQVEGIRSLTAPR